MTITSHLFEAYLKCPTKFFLRSHGEAGTGNAYADWARIQNESYRRNSIERLANTVSPGELVTGPPRTENVKTAIWRLAVDFTAAGEHVESTIHVVERIPTEGRGASARFIPTRFIFTNKLGRDDKLLLAFDAFAFSKVTGDEVRLAKIVHGDNHATLKVRTDTLAGELGKLIRKATTLVSSDSPPDLVLNRHCAECEFQARCRQKAVEKDDLSLLSSMTAKERKKFNIKGIFTVTQLSFTFRPRRRPKRLRNKREKYHHAVKALAIQQKKIHIVGNPQLKIEGTPVYLDVEALPDLDYYYLIGIRVNASDSVVQRSFWVDEADGEGKAWREFLDMLAEIVNPVLIHYGSFETVFLKRMAERYGEPLEGSGAANAIKSALNLVSFLFAQVYFPTYSNALKEIASWLGYKWSSTTPSGTQAIIWRMNWEQSRDPSIKQKLMIYNLEDCHALQVLTETLLRVCSPDQWAKLERGADPEVVLSGNPTSRDALWRRFSSPIADFEVVNKAARWDYQRDRVYVRTDKLLKSARPARMVRTKRATPITKEVYCSDLQVCPVCGRSPDKVFRKRPRVLFDIRFSKFGLRRWVVKFHFRFYWCGACKERFGMPDEFWPHSMYGRNLVALIVYETIELCVPQLTAKERLTRLFGLTLAPSMLYDLKAGAAEYYAETRQQILTQITKGNLIHADETPIALKDRHGYVWIFATFHEVVYFYADTREGDLVRERLEGFRGVLVSDFYTAYDSLPCPQQKCLLHMMRDLNEAVLDYPFDEELKQVVTGFAGLLKGIVQTIDRWGLKRRFLGKHLTSVDRFYRQISKAAHQSESAVKWKERLEKNRAKLFTFLAYDGVPWNNNNAEHAIKAFARLRRVIGGLSSPKGIDAFVKSRGRKRG